MKKQSKLSGKPVAVPAAAPVAAANGTEPADEEVDATTESTEPDPEGWGEAVSLTASRPALPELVIQQHTGEFRPELAKIMIYGESGAGKTRFACGFPDVLVCDMDNGLSSVDWPIDAITVEDFRQLSAAYEYLRTGEHSYKAVVLDTVNEMQRLAMGATVKQFQRIKRSYGNLPSQSDYGKMLHDMIDLTRDFLALPMQVILLAQSVSRVFETDMLKPQLIGKSTANELVRKMDIVGYISRLTVEGTQVPVIDFANDLAVTKDRSYRLPARLVDASYESLISAWQ